MNTLAGSQFRPMERVHVVGVIGVGTMGHNFVQWLLEGGFDVYAYDIDEDRLEAAKAMGASASDNATHLAAQSDCVVLSLPGSEYVEQAMGGPNGVIEGIGDGDIVLDTGTTRIETDVHYQRECAERGADLLDAPVTWGGPGDRTTMFVGGDEQSYRRAKPVIETLSSQHHHFGEVGSGQVVKGGHRLRQNNHAMVDAETVEFWRNNGVDPEAVDELLELGLHPRMFEEEYPSTSGWDTVPEGEQSEETEESGPRLSAGVARPRMDVSHWAKDQAYAIEIGHSSNTALPVSSAVYHAMLMSENYASALFDRSLGFQDPEWYDRADPITHFRRLNRPAEQWRRLEADSDDPAE